MWIQTRSMKFSLLNIQYWKVMLKICVKDHQKYLSLFDTSFSVNFMIHTLHIQKHDRSLCNAPNEIFPANPLKMSNQWQAKTITTFLWTNFTFKWCMCTSIINLVSSNDQVNHIMVHHCFESNSLRVLVVAVAYHWRTKS